MHLAQLNIATAKYDLETIEMKDFMDNLDPINAIAESSKGFVWRLQDEAGDATSIQFFDDPRTIVNMSIWESVDSLKDFMFRTHHKDFFKRKSEWFTKEAEDTYVLWWVPEGTIPTLEQAVQKLYYLRKHGETPQAFTFKSNFKAEKA
ncbi:DUF3291 domain-containing protein [Colwellia sp. UCD-KL20]|uniref:DUF3291 domain-containing protein n=1 Tax=Colwellia sp. UCD-KL20 TaxID=1917165 RepID=UPI0009709E5D|nr:DUF3291 domain-containing protein [Colwellia sp. UCD-KL20]